MRLCAFAPLAPLARPLRRPGEPAREAPRRMHWAAGGLRGSAAGDVAVSGAALLGATAVVGVSGALRARGVVSGRAARKVVHSLCGVAYVLLWPLYSAAGRAAAAAVPVAALLALGALRGPLARAVGREPDADAAPGAALRGPAVYAGVLLAVTLALWKTPAAYVVVAQLCAGDAAAEIAGRRFGTVAPWPFAKDKSVPGSAAFAAAAAPATLALLAFYSRCETAAAIPIRPAVVPAVLIISLACAAAELVPERLVGDDNAAISVTAAALALLLLQ